MKPNTNKALDAPDTDAPALWEQRSLNRVLESGGDQLLDRSRLIVEAADELLREEGLEGLTIRAVLKKTGLSRRAFYERFTGKDDLMLAVFERTLKGAADRYSEMIESLDDPLESLRLIVTSIVLGANPPAVGSRPVTDRRSAAMSREHMRLAESHPEELQETLSPLTGLIARQLALGMEQGVVREADPLRLTALLYNMVATTAHMEFLTRESKEPDMAHREQLAADTWEFCRRAIAAPA